MRSSALAFGAMILLAGAAQADGFQTTVTPVQPGPTGWQFRFTPYAWLAWSEGDAVVRGRDFKVSATPADVLEHLNFAWMSYQEARRGAITLFSDVIYGNVSNSDSFVTSGMFSPSVSGTVGAALSADFRFWIVEAGFMYETNRYKWGSSAAETDTTLDLLAGVRYWRQKLDVDLALAGTMNVDGLVVSGATAVARSGGVDWFDPFIGARLTHTTAPGQQIMLRGDFGGFGIGSQFTWQLLGTYTSYLGTHAGIDFDAYLGYKALSVDYDRGNGIDRYEFDVIQHGPVIGLTGTF